MLGVYRMIVMLVKKDKFSKFLKDLSNCKS